MLLALFSLYPGYPGYRLQTILVPTRGLCALPARQGAKHFPEPVFVNDLAHWKRLTRNWFFCELIRKSFPVSTNAIHKYLWCFRNFFKNLFFLNNIDSCKESDRTYSFDMFKLFVWLFCYFYIKILFVTFFFSIRTTYMYLFSSLVLDYFYYRWTTKYSKKYVCE